LNDNTSQKLLPAIPKHNSFSQTRNKSQLLLSQLTDNKKYTFWQAIGLIHIIPIQMKNDNPIQMKNEKSNPIEELILINPNQNPLPSE
jgi:hypothetical protein